MPSPLNPLGPNRKKGSLHQGQTFFAKKINMLIYRYIAKDPISINPGNLKTLSINVNINIKITLDNNKSLLRRISFL